MREKSGRDTQNGEDIDRTDMRQFCSQKKALEIFHGACPVSDRRLNVCFIGLNMHFGFETIKKSS